MSDERRDPLHELRRADPVQSSPAPSDRKARVWARIQEATMEEERVRSRRRRGWIAGVGSVAVAGVAALALLLNAGGGAPARTADPDTGIGSCIETYSPATLAARDLAFDGTVTAVSGDDVTFAVNEAFHGELDGSVTLRAAGMVGTSVTSAGGPTLTVGSRYLVAGDDDFAWACGFTQPYDEGTAADWAGALR